ncbi:MAG: hypothetical protein A2636_06300 [Elusimicrobia bacterium RIFCSPHIGHO2_01_FULL_64_10]|nr:MAG: hypothetical protein A2636_06300 [Elusimicrobia bacterium RIFCSPHIGHO2_01_FULL_64_10]
MTPWPAIPLPKRPRLLLVRPDNLGDVILTTPAALALKEKYPDAFIAYLCRGYAAPLLKCHPAVDEVVLSDDPALSVFGLPELLCSLRFDAAIHFYLDNRTAFAAWRAGIPVRVGPRSKAAALFLSHRLVQNRSLAEKHEAQYNLDLAAILGASPAPRSPEVAVAEEEKSRAGEILSGENVRPDRPLAVIHPGSKGSAKSWPLDHFMELAKRLAGAGAEVLITAGKGEEAVIDKAEALFHPPDPSIHPIPAGSLTLRELAGILSVSRLAVSNSTGPLHLAVALKVPTLSFYPLIPKTTSARRWGPFGDPARQAVLSPREDSAPMSSITVDEAERAAKALLKI